MPSMTITTTAGQATRMQDAIQRETGAAQAPDATAVKNFWVHQMRVFVQESERRAAVKAAEVAAATPTAFDPT